MFSREFEISPHQYMTSRRIDLARRLLLDGMPPSLTAAEADFYGQSHLDLARKLGQRGNKGRVYMLPVTPSHG